MWWLDEPLLLRSRLPADLFLGILADYRLRLGCSDSRRCFLGTRVMVPLALPGRFAVIQCSLGVERPLSSTLPIRVVRVVLVGCDNFARPDIVRPSTKVRTTRC
jgi:hypothetical protein